MYKIVMIIVINVFTFDLISSEVIQCCFIAKLSQKHPVFET